MRLLMLKVRNYRCLFGGVIGCGMPLLEKCDQESGSHQASFYSGRPMPLGRNGQRSYIKSSVEYPESLYVMQFQSVPQVSRTSYLSQSSFATEMGRTRSRCTMGTYTLPGQWDMTHDHNNIVQMPPSLANFPTCTLTIIG